MEESFRHRRATRMGGGEVKTECTAQTAVLASNIKDLKITSLFLGLLSAVGRSLSREARRNVILSVTRSRVMM